MGRRDASNLRSPYRQIPMRSIAAAKQTFERVVNAHHSNRTVLLMAPAPCRRCNIYWTGIERPARPCRRYRQIDLIHKGNYMEKIHEYPKQKLGDRQYCGTPSYAITTAIVSCHARYDHSEKMFAGAFTPTHAKFVFVIPW